MAEGELKKRVNDVIKWVSSPSPSPSPYPPLSLPLSLPSPFPSLSVTSSPGQLDSD